MGITKQKTVDELTANQSAEFWDREWRESPYRMSTLWSGFALDWMNKDLTQIRSVLDVGCGDCSTVCAFDFDGIQRHIICLDISSEALELAKQNNGHSNSSFDFVQGSATDIRFPGNSFDMVTSFEMITLLGDAYIGALNEMWRVTRGYLVFNVTYKGFAPQELVSLDERETANVLATLSPSPKEQIMHAVTWDEFNNWSRPTSFSYSQIHSEGGDAKINMLVMMRK